MTGSCIKRKGKLSFPMSNKEYFCLSIFGIFSYARFSFYSNIRFLFKKSNFKT